MSFPENRVKCLNYFVYEIKLSVLIYYIILGVLLSKTQNRNHVGRKGLKVEEYQGGFSQVTLKLGIPSPGE